MVPHFRTASLHGKERPVGMLPSTCTPSLPPMVSPAAELERLAVAALVGFLIGLDRERAETRKAHPLFAGVRTFPLIALAGAAPMLLIRETGPFLVVASFAGIAAVVLVSYFRASAGGRIGATTEVAALAT